MILSIWGIFTIAIGGVGTHLSTLAEPMLATQEQKQGNKWVEKVNVINVTKTKEKVNVTRIGKMGEIGEKICVLFIFFNIF